MSRDRDGGWRQTRTTAEGRRAMGATAVLIGLIAAGCAAREAPPLPPPAPLIYLDYGKEPAGEAAPATEETKVPKAKKKAPPKKRLRAGPRPVEPGSEPQSGTAIERETRLRMDLQRYDSELDVLNRRLESYDRDKLPSVREIQLYGTGRARRDEAINRRTDLERRGVEAERRSTQENLSQQQFQERILGTGASQR